MRAEAYWANAFFALHRRRLCRCCCLVVYWFILHWNIDSLTGSHRVELSQVGSDHLYIFGSMAFSIAHPISQMVRLEPRSILHLIQSQNQNSYIPNPFICCESTESEWRKKNRIIRCRSALCLNIVWISKTIAIGNTAFFPWTMSLEF